MPSPAPRRIGLLGGTFDPPHVGHLAAAIAVRDALALPQVALVVANEPWQKSGSRHISPAHIRLAMARALVEGHEGITVDDREIRRGGPTYTVDTLTELHEENLDHELFLIVGADTAARIHTWHRYTEVISLSTLVIVNRTDASPDLAPDVAAGRIVNITMTPVDVSSTAVREAVSAGKPIDAFTTASVRAIIETEGLYREVSQ